MEEDSFSTERRKNLAFVENLPLKIAFFQFSAELSFA